MNITEKILDLEHERSELIINYSKTKERVKETNTQIKKLRTIKKHAEEVLGTKVEENGQAVKR